MTSQITYPVDEDEVVTVVAAPDRVAAASTKPTRTSEVTQFSNQDLIERLAELEAKVAAAPTPIALPPGAEYRNGQLVRVIHNTNADGKTTTIVRSVALDQQQAREKCIDWYHPTLGWARYGFKLEKDRTPQDIMSDASVAQYNPKIIKEVSDA